MATRRKAPVGPTSDMPDDRPTLTRANSSTTQSPYLPTTLEATLLAIYPLTLLLGSLFSVLNTRNRTTPYNPTTQSHDPSVAPSYFARKSNIFNVYFVKVGWFWTTLAFSLFLVSHSSLGPRLRPVVTPRRLQALLRYTLTTIVWGAVTQWFFGPALIDRGYTFTGGKCEYVVREGVDLGSAKSVASHAACKAVHGVWKGGHDISGHVFILILGSAMLWFELLPAVLRASGLREDRRVRMADGKVVSAAVETVDKGGRENMEVPPSQELGFGVKAALGVAGLSWWMLLMTASYFHTWFEKFTGLVVAFAALYVVYFLPRAIPAYRQIVGMPGV